MVKLLRLTTENNCQFAADLDAGIEVSENSSIAVQNLTFETNYDVLNVGNNNNQVLYQWDTAANGGVGTVEVEGRIETKNYTRETINELPDTVITALNDTQSVDQSETLELNRNYAEWGGLVSNLDDIISINYKLSPITMPFHTNEGGRKRRIDRENILYGISKAEGPGAILIDSLLVSDFFQGEGIILGNLNQNVATSAATNLTKNFIFPSHACGTLSQGGGMFMCYIADLISNGGASDTNGFGMGLSFTDLQTKVELDATDQISIDDRNFELRVNDPLQPFTFLSHDQPTIVQTAALSPFKYAALTDTDPATHDILMIEKKGDRIIGSICNLDGGNGGVKNEIFNYILSYEESAKPLYPYIYACGAGDQTVIGHPTFTPHVIEVDNLEYQITGQEQKLIMGGVTNQRNVFELYTITNTVYTDVFQNILNNQQFVDDVYSSQQRLKITLPADIMKVIGFDTTPGQPTVVFDNLGSNNTRIRTTNPMVCGFSLIANDNVIATNSDNYSVVIDSNPVMSYDASQFNYDDTIIDTLPKTQHKRGRRLNILATIPVNDTTGIVEYDSNELVYIDLDNSFPQVLKNIRIRVLNKKFKEVLTIGTAVITLLIKD